jgi:hypothetical protein
MSRPSRNNRRGTRGLYTTNPTQYLQFQNFDKYKHIYDARLDYIIVINKMIKDPKATFGYVKLLNYLEINDHLDHIRNINALHNNNRMEHFDITDISSEGFTVKTLGMKFIFVKDDLDNLVIFKDEEREFEGKVIMLTPNGNISHIYYKSTRIYFKCYVIADVEYAEIIKSIIGFLSYYYQ